MMMMMMICVCVCLYAEHVSVHGNESVNTFSPSFRLDVDHLLQEFMETDREDEISQVLTFIKHSFGM